MQWIKDKNNKWILSTNDILYSDFKENLKPTTDLNIVVSDNNKPVIYIPTHNIHDVYEWFRIFKDSYLYSTNFDKYGFAIHGYFNKDRGESIQGWFPNLIKVKAASADTLVYTVINNQYFRNSVDYIKTFNNLTELFIDGVQIFNEELVLLKNQYTDILSFYTVNPALTTNNVYYVSNPSTTTPAFVVGNPVVLLDSNNNFFIDTILSLDNIVINTVTYLIITTKNSYTNIIKIADQIIGPWATISYENQNGIYQYLNGNLTLIHEMFDKYKTYNQITYVYQGNTNENNEFYLRRIEDIGNPLYTQYPVSGTGNPLVYSQGEAYLIKCEIDYNLNTLIPPHPLTNPPYDSSTDAYRLLFLDNTMADKIMSTGINGLGPYIIEGNYIDLKIAYKYNIGSNHLSSIKFNTFDKSNINNIFYTLNNTIYENATVKPNYTFFPKNITSSSQAFKIDFNKYNNNALNSTSSMSITNTSTYSNILIQYPTTGGIKFPFSTLYNGDFVNITFTYYNITTGTSYVALQEQFIIQSSSTTPNLSLNVWPILDINIINEFNNITADTTGTIYANVNIELINQYGDNIVNYIDYNYGGTLLLQSLNKTIVGKYYDFYTKLDPLTNSTYLYMTDIKQDHHNKYDNYQVYLDLTNNVIGDYIAYITNLNTVNNSSIYFKNYYSINNFLTSYLNCGNIDLAQMQPVTLTYKNILNDLNRFGIEGSNKLTNRGNIIYFGPGLRSLITDNIKPSTYIKITPTTTGISNAWVESINWNYETNLGTIITLSDILIPTTFESITISLNNNIHTDVSNSLLNLFNKKLNNTGSGAASTIEQVYKPDTASYAYAMLNYAYDTGTTNINTDILNNVTGIVYKDYNEPRISFLKRDKSFLLNNNIVEVVAMATSNINITSSPNIIDTVTLTTNNLILLNNQTDTTKNGIWIFIATGQPLQPYGSMALLTYWFITQGSLNVNKYFRINYTFPLTSSSTISFTQVYFNNLKDDRLTMKPVEIAKLGVDNLIQPWQKINIKYDSIETSVNQLNIQIGINNRHRIRFIDGLTENNITNNINGQGQYSWILDDTVIVDDAVVGCTQDSGPGTGTLIWYTGIWTEGVWVNGIWIQGTWESGTWLNGIWNAYPIQDYYYYVTYSLATNNLLSIWQTGVWVNGIWNGGIAENISWSNGTFNNGVIQEGTWLNGIFNNGIIQHIIWTNGNFNGGDFETGIWYAGILNQIDPTIPARFGTKANGSSNKFNDRAIWYSGQFNGGQFWSGLNYSDGVYYPSLDHTGSVFYSGQFLTGDFWGGSFITGVFKNATWHEGVWFGGYYISSIVDATGNDKTLTINPAQYDAILGLTTTIGYISNTMHRLDKYYQTQFELIATPTSNNTFTSDAFINQNDILYNTPYLSKSYVLGTVTATQINLTISSHSASGTTYIIANPTTHTVDGRPFICAEFTNSNWNGGIWLNGYFSLSNWYSGVWLNGFANDCTYGGTTL